MGAVLQRKEGGEPDAILFIAEDITDSLNNNEELKRTQELIHETERMHRYGMYSYDILHNTLTCSDGIYALFETDKSTHNGSPEFF